MSCYSVYSVMNHVHMYSMYIPLEHLIMNTADMSVCVSSLLSCYRSGSFPVLVGGVDGLVVDLPPLPNQQLGYRRSRRLSEPAVKDFPALMAALGARWVHKHTHTHPHACCYVTNLYPDTEYMLYFHN